MIKSSHDYAQYLESKSLGETDEQQATFTMDYETRVAERRRAYREEQEKLRLQRSHSQNLNSDELPDRHEEPLQTSQAAFEAESSFLTPPSSAHTGNAAEDNLLIDNEPPKRRVEVSSANRWEDLDDTRSVLLPQMSYHNAKESSIGRVESGDKSRLEDSKLKDDTKQKFYDSLQTEKNFDEQRRTQSFHKETFAASPSTILDNSVLDVNQRKQVGDRIEATSPQPVLKEAERLKMDNLKQTPPRESEVSDTAKRRHLGDNGLESNARKSFNATGEGVFLEPVTAPKAKEAYTAYLVLDSGATVGPFLYENLS